MDHYDEARKLYRNLLRAAVSCPALGPGQVKLQAEMLVGLSLPDLYRRDAGRLAMDLPWSAEQVWAACRSVQASQRRSPNGASDAHWPLWDLLGEDCRATLLAAWPELTTPGSHGHQWETLDEIDQIMREVPKGELAKMLAGSTELLVPSRGGTGLPRI